MQSVHKRATVRFAGFLLHLHFPDSGMGRYSRVWNGGFQAFTARPAGNPLAPQCRPRHLRFMKTRPYSPSSHYVFLNTYTCQIPTGYVFLSTYTSWISRWEALEGPEWWFAGLYGRKPLAPPNADLATRALCRQNTQLFFNSYVFLSTYTSLIPGWGGTPGSGMVVSRPLRRGLPETPWPPNADPATCAL